MTEYHSVRAFAREEPRIELIESTLRSLLQLVDLEFEGEPVKVDGFRLRDLEDWRTAPGTSLQLNLGSLSTKCSCRCAFCYEDGSPPGLLEREPCFVGMQEARTRRSYLHHGRGLPLESKSQFEALLNPRFLDLVRMMRDHDLDRLIDLTTNGAQLTSETIAALAEMKPILVSLSLNSSDVGVRGRLMCDRYAGQAIRALELLRAHGIPFQGSLVPWPQQGLDDLMATIEYLDAHQARLIRVALPALTKYHPRFRPEAFREWLPAVLGCIADMRHRVDTPIIVSPFTHVTSSLDPVVEGVIRRSPAESAGLRTGDCILSVDGKEVVSRTHAASLLERAASRGHALLRVKRSEAVFETALGAPLPDIDLYPYQPRGYPRLDTRATPFGLCLPGSFHLSYVKRIYDTVVERGSRRVLVLVSAHFRAVVAELLANLPLPPGTELELLTPTNHYFGGDIDVADLWVLEDVAASVAEHVRVNGPADLLVMPGSFLSRWGRDLLGVPYTALASALGVEVSVIPTERIIL